MEVTLQLIFTNEAGGRVTLSIPKPREELTAAQVEATMDSIVAADVITSAGGGLAGKVRALLVSRQSQIIAEF